MEEQKIKTQVFLELLIQQSQENSSEELLSKMLPMYMRKLNCFMAAVVNKNYNSTVIPTTMQNDSLWDTILSEVKTFNDRDNNTLYEKQISDFYFYFYPLYNYGHLILGKKQNFPKSVKYELKPIINQLGKTLCNNEEEESLRLFQKLINFSTDAIQVASEDGTLCYINYSAAERLGINQENPSVYKVYDYEEIFKDEEMWRNFTQKIKDDDSLVIESNHINVKTKTHIPVESNVKRIHMGEKTFFIFNSRNIYDRKKSEEMIRFQSDFQKLIADISSDFISAGSITINDKIDSMLTRMGEFFGVDRCYIIEFTEDNLYMNNTYEWCAPNVSPQKEHINKLPLNEYSYLVNNIYKNGFCYIPDVNKLPNDAYAEKKELQRQEVITLLSVAININNEVKGFLGFDTTKEIRHFSENDISLLQILANTLADAKIKINRELELIKQNGLQKLLMNIATKYINIELSEIENTLNTTLGELANYVNADRAYIFEYNWEENVCNNTYEWCSEGVSPEIDNLQGVPNEFISRWVDTHKNGHTMYIDDVMTLPEDDGVRITLEPQGVKSLIAIPIMNNKECVGFVGFDSVKQKYKYSENEKNLLLLFAQMLVNVHNRKTVDINLHKYSEELEFKNLELDIALAKAQSASKAKTEFLANMSHEIRTPLNGIIGFTDLLLQTPLNDIQKQYTQNVNTSGQALMGIINDILDFSKIEAGKLELDIIKTDIIELIEQSSDIIKYHADQKNLELLLNISPQMPRYALVDPVRLKQILVNLLNNAVKFTEMGEVELKIDFTGISEDLGRYKISVRDTGIGISDEQIQKLFKSFSQADSSTTRKYGGTGLGLVISNMLAEKMGGQITVESELNQGSVFSLIIEAKFENGDSFSIDESFPVKRVLIIDDNANNRQILEENFKYWGIECTSCSNGLVAMDKLITSQTYDVLIVDYHMPFIDGLETIKMIRDKLQLTPEKMPVILLHSSSNDEKLREDCKKLGVRFHLVKPVKSKELLNYLKNIKTTETQTENKYEASSKTKDTGVIMPGMFKVLIVDDVPLNIFLVKELIKNEIDNVITVEATSGDEAIAMYKAEQPDLIFMDIQMPVKNGYQVTAEIRELEKKSGVITPIIALTAGAMKGEKEKCFNAGMDDFLIKPIDRIAFSELINKYSKNLQVSLKNSQAAITQDTDFETDLHFDYRHLLNKFDNNKEFIHEMMKVNFLQSKKDLDNLEKAIKLNIHDEIKLYAHKIKGSNSNMNFNIMAQLSKQLEESDFNNNVNLNRILVKLKDEFSYLVSKYSDI